MFLNKLKPTLQNKFLKDEKGAVAIEAMIMIPAILIVLVSIFTLYDAFRQNTMHQKAAYTIGDMVSRETMSIDNDYIDGVQGIFKTLTRSSQESSVRISILYYDEGTNTFKLDWSESRGDHQALTENDVSGWATRLPVLVDQERIIVVETYADYVPPFNTGLGTREISNFIFTRPRYAPQVTWTDS